MLKIQVFEDLGLIKFEIPYRELQFNGVPSKDNVVIYPTPSCLISLSATPFLVITINEIEVIYFERVSQNLKMFDMAIIFKDFSRPPKKISAIPMENLDMLKTWADENDIFYGEGQYNLIWTKIMNNIEEVENDDPEYEEEEIESSEDDYEQEEEEESEGENEGDDALSEEGKSWDSMEEEAKKLDIEKAKKIKEKENFKKNNKNKRKK